MIKKGLIGAMLATATLLVFSGAAHAQYGGPDEPIAVVQGESIAVTGDGCAANATVTFTLTSGDYTAVVGSTTADADGTYEGTVTIPSDAPAGPATLSNSCEPSVLALNVSASPAGPVNPGTLPRTGSNTQTLVGVGAGFLLLGGTLAIGARRTRRTTVA